MLSVSSLRRAHTRCIVIRALRGILNSWLVSVIYIARAGKPDDSGAWAKIKDVLLEEDGFGYDHHHVLQNFEYNC